MIFNCNWLSIIPLFLMLTVINVDREDRGLQAQPQPREYLENVIAQANQSRIYVDPNQGNDLQGQGTESAPFRTITQALMLAEADTTIILAPGKYSAETGETFPLLLNTEVSIQGHPRSQGHNVIIQGNGTFISRTGAGQNVTIVVQEASSKLTGVTVTNPHDRGYALWIESGSPEITHNTFTRNGGSGVSINSDSRPLIAKNYFYHNRGNGVIIYGTSAPYIRDNTFEKTGFGISVMENAQPRLENNQIIGNRLGVILEENAQAVLRHNVIEQSTEHGLVAIAQSRADLGTKEEPGNNLFRRNRELDIRNLTSHSISAVGTELEGNFQGQVDFGNSLIVNLPDPTPQKEIQPPSAPLPTANKPESVTREENGAIYIPVPPPETPGQSLPPSPPSPVNSTSLSRPQPQYRVLVEANSRQTQQIKTLYPDAFNTRHQGNSLIQVGLFTNWANAQQVLEDLQSLGLNQMIILLD